MKKKILDLMKTEFLKNLSLADLELLEGEEGGIKKRVLYQDFKYQ